jgi:hypothetical protein
MPLGEAAAVGPLFDVAQKPANRVSCSGSLLAWRQQGAPPREFVPDVRQLGDFPMSLFGRLCPFILLLGCLLVFGCNRPGPVGLPASRTGHDDDDEHEHHESYAAAVQELDGLRLAAKNAMAEDNLKAADDAVHEIGHILEELPALAEKEIGAADDQVKPAIDELFDCFDQIDQKLEGGAGKTYDEVAERIDVAMATLRSKVKSQEK